MLPSLRHKLFADFKANRGQFLAVWFVVMLGTAFYGAMYPSGISMLGSFHKTYDELSYMNFQVQFDPIDQSIVPTPESLESVESFEERLVVETGLQVSPDSDYLITLRLISLPEDHELSVNTLDIVSGRNVEANNEIVVLKSFADRQDYNVGDIVTIVSEGESRDVEIVGLAFSVEYAIAGRSPSNPYPSPSTFGIGWMNYTPLAEFTGYQGLVNEVVVHLEGISAEETTELDDSVRAELNTLYGDLDNVVILHREQTASGSVVMSLINGNFPIMIFFSGVFLLGSVVMTSILLGRVVQGERRRIGTMRAMGITRSELVEHYLSFGLIIGVTGGLVGSAFGYLNSFWVMATFVKYVIGGTLPTFANPPQWGFLGLGFAIAVIGSTIAGVYPAWVESGTPPGVALRPTAPKSLSAVTRINLPFLPLIVRQSIRNLLRTPGRSLSTALGVILGAMMIFSAFAMWDSNEFGAKSYFDSIDYDLRADFNTLLPVDTLETRIAEIDGVDSVQGALFGPVSVVSADGDAYDTFAVSVDESDPFVDLTTLDGEDGFTSAEGVWIGNNLARTQDVAVGDTIVLQAFGQDQEVIVLGIVSQLVGSPVYVPRSLMTQWTPGGLFPTNSALIRVEDGQIEAVRDALVNLQNLVAVEVMDEFKADVDNFTLFFRVGTIIFGGFGYLLTLAVLFNTVNAGLRERQTELSILRALGSSAREIAIVVLLELLIMTVIGIVIGMPIGRMVGFNLLSAYNTDNFAPMTIMLGVSYVVGFLSLVIIVFLAAVPGLNAVQRVDLGMVSKSQSM